MPHFLWELPSKGYPWQKPPFLFINVIGVTVTCPSHLLLLDVFPSLVNPLHWWPHCSYFTLMQLFHKIMILNSHSHAPAWTMLLNSERAIGSSSQLQLFFIEVIPIDECTVQVRLCTHWKSLFFFLWPRCVKFEVTHCLKLSLWVFKICMIEFQVLGIRDQKCTAGHGTWELFFIYKISLIFDLALVGISAFSRLIHFKSFFTSFMVMLENYEIN